MALRFLVFFAFLIAQRLIELRLSARNERRLRTAGAIEFGATHYKYIVALHVAFLVSLLLEVVFLNRHPAPWWWLPFALFLVAQGLRYWSIISLGYRWNTRILVIPGQSPVARGPYRFFPHPNYLAVAIELFSIPVIFQAYITAAVFTLLNAVMMSVRIPAETRALRTQ